MNIKFKLTKIPYWCIPGHSYTMRLLVFAPQNIFNRRQYSPWYCTSEAGYKPWLNHISRYFQWQDIHAQSLQWFGLIINGRYFYKHGWMLHGQKWIFHTFLGVLRLFIIYLCLRKVSTNESFLTRWDLVQPQIKNRTWFALAMIKVTKQFGRYQVYWCPA